ncbi:hypothetical protein HanIR_Chr05g0237891 [Helianthus annuus]|nr:hypothetical protein HanIR_Chr05g0237891 [Helianthus annuus]
MPHTTPDHLLCAAACQTTSSVHRTTRPELERRIREHAERELLQAAA